MNPPDEQQPPSALPTLSPSRKRPWDIHPALTEDRLRACALLLAHARRDAVRLAAYDMGDDSWSVGCRAYAFGRQRLRRAADRGTYNWLTVLDESHHFVFLIEDVPVRFYRGLADEPTARTLRRQAVEAQQLTLALGEEKAEGLIFRFALEASAAAGVERIVFLALRGEEGQVECFWPVCLDVPSTGVTSPEQAQLRFLGYDLQNLARPSVTRNARRNTG